LESFRGIYEDASGVDILLNPNKSFPHFVIMKTGETHMLRQRKTGGFEFSSTRNSWDTIGGSVEFRKTEAGNQFCMTRVGKASACFTGVPMNSRVLNLNIAGGVTIFGEMFEPQMPKSDLVAVLLHGDGANDRYDLFDIGMYLVSQGFRVFAFDKRNAGKSRGPDVEDLSYYDVSNVYASDAAGIISSLKAEYPGKRFGVVGASQGGWIGAIVSANVPDMAFYVNIAGNISIGWKQWRHYMISYLKRSGFTKADVAEAEAYFESFFGAGLGKVDFEAYRMQMEKARGKDWFKKLKLRRLIEWKDKETAVKIVKRNSFDPAADIRKVKSPALGIFYEFDHSTPPDSPTIFLRNLTTGSASNDAAVRVFPNATHGGWTVSSYYFDTAKITRLESDSFYFIASWLETL
jgi:pimeloyl-ACP methyl ester carboxylesterase